jgi:hypothetical protein
MKKYVAIFHANLNYAFLSPEGYERVIRSSYELIIDTFAKFPDQKYVFEASGYTIEQMEKIAPDVIVKLKKAVKSGQCEFMGAPYSHPIMANIPEEDAYWSCEFAMRTFKKILGFKPESFWNPECTWKQYVPRAFKRAGVKYLTLDFESYMNCNDKDYAWVERNRTSDIGWGGHIPWYDLDPNCKFLHRPFRNIVPGLHGMCRSDRLVGKYIGYFLGKGNIDDYINNVKKWTGKEENGATIIIADDAEYCGTTGYFYVKHYNDYSKSFAVDPLAGEKLYKLIEAIKKIGKFITFKEACGFKPVEEPFYVEDNFAWHRTYSNAWAGTPEAKRFDPIVTSLRKDYKDNVQPIVEKNSKFRPLYEKFWFHLTNSSNSDGRWPPPPATTCEFNRWWVENEIKETRKVLAELKNKIKGMKLPPPKEYDNPGDGVYGYYFTDKNPRDVKNLNTYELQHAIYYEHKKVDSKRPAISKDGIKHLKKVFDELDRRGMKGIRPPRISGKK